VSDILVIDRLEPVPKQSVLCLKGPMTTQTVSSFHSAIRNESSPIVIVDLSDVPYLDSAGLGSLVRAYITCHKFGQQVVLTGVNSRILKLFEISRVDSIFLMFPTMDDAIAAFLAPAQA